MVDEARAQARKGVAGKMEGHADMHMEVTEGGFWQRIRSEKGRTAISHYFVMDWVSVWKDVAGGVLIAGALAAWVPPDWWASIFLVSHPTWAIVWGPILGPVIAIVSFVCSVGNIPLAAVLWSGGISFGGAIAFIFADLIVLPILDIYRKYYGWRTMWFLLATFYVSMAGAALAVELVFAALGRVPAHRAARITETSISFDYTTALNVVFLLLAGMLVRRFLKTGGPEMLKMMDMPPGETEGMTGMTHGGAHGHGG
jgi:uncharacterized membrane protein YraQ (UPF0718 family)